jgi:hypothetical protein
MTVDKTKKKLALRFKLSDDQLKRYWQRAWREAAVAHKEYHESPKVEAVRAIFIRLMKEKGIISATTSESSQ